MPGSLFLFFRGRANGFVGATLCRPFVCSRICLYGDESLLHGSLIYFISYTGLTSRPLQLIFCNLMVCSRPFFRSRFCRYMDESLFTLFPILILFFYFLGKEVGRLDSPYPSPNPYLSPQRTGGSKKFKILKILNSLRSDSKIFLTNLKFFDLNLNDRSATFSGNL